MMLNRIKHFYRKMKRSYKFLRIYWNTADYDWSSILIVMRYQISQVRQHINEHAMIAGYEKLCRQMLIAETLLTRMIADDYFDVVTKRAMFFRSPQKDYFNVMYSLQKQDEEMLYNILTKHLKSSALYSAVILNNPTPSSPIIIASSLSLSEYIRLPTSAID